MKTNILNHTMLTIVFILIMEYIMSVIILDKDILYNNYNVKKTIYML
jgi:hypothetical protein